jgi:hypothetical protein
MADILESEKMPNHHTVYCEPMNENELFLYNKREKWKELMRQRRSNETSEQRQKRLNQMRLYARHRRANETPEQRQKRLSQMNIYARNRRANESLDQRVKRLMQMNNYEKQRRANETAEQREERKRKRRELENLRRKRETPEERQKCLIAMNKCMKQQRNERQFNQINNYGEQERLRKTYEQEEEHRTQEKKEVIQETNKIYEHQEEWWRQQQEEDAHRRSVPHEDICIQREKLPVLQRRYKTLEHKQVECMQKEDDRHGEHDTNVVLHIVR